MAVEFALTAPLLFLFVFAGVLGATMLTRSLMGADVRPPVMTAFAFALLLACGSIATAPAATLFVLREYDAKGPVTDTMLSLVGINNIICIVLFQISFVVLAASGALEWPAGALPSNTRGGGLSEAYVHGFNLVLEGVRQIRGTSTSQVEDAEISLVTSGAGVPTSALLLCRS